MSNFNSFQDVYQHIRDLLGCSQKTAHTMARRCYFDRALCWEVLGIEPSQLSYKDNTGEWATDNVMTGATT